jgi:hypothetical protein
MSITGILPVSFVSSASFYDAEKTTKAKTRAGRP